MIGTLTVFLPSVFVLIELRTIVPDRGICIRVAGGSMGVRTLTLLVVYSGGIVCCSRCCVCSGRRRYLFNFWCWLGLAGPLCSLWVLPLDGQFPFLEFSFHLWTVGYRWL